jgi:hypothetical protein
MIESCCVVWRLTGARLMPTWQRLGLHPRTMRAVRATAVVGCPIQASRMHQEDPGLSHRTMMSWHLCRTGLYG